MPPRTDRLTRRGIVTAVLSAIVAGSACTSPTGSAEPAVPQPGGLCPGMPDHTLTRLAGGEAVLQCRDGRWESSAEIYPASDSWLTYGPELTLHGQARRNPEIMAGNWVGLPRDSQGSCSAAKSDVIVAGQLAPPQQLSGEPGKPLRVAVTTQLFALELRGNCLWRKES